MHLLLLLDKIRKAIGLTVHEVRWSEAGSVVCEGATPGKGSVQRDVKQCAKAPKRLLALRGFCDWNTAADGFGCRRRALVPLNSLKPLFHFAWDKFLRSTLVKSIFY